MHPKTGKNGIYYCWIRYKFPTISFHFQLITIYFTSANWNLLFWEKSYCWDWLKWRFLDHFLRLNFGRLFDRKTLVKCYGSRASLINNPSCLCHPKIFHCLLMREKGKLFDSAKEKKFLFSLSVQNTKMKKSFMKSRACFII